MDKTIFVVDDVGINLSVTKAVLEDKYTVVTVSSGKKALALMEKITPHLILLDIDMPEMDGFAVMERLKSDDRYIDIPVVFLTAMHDRDAEAKGLKMGAVDFILKPFDTPVLLNKVAYHLA